MNSQTLIVYRKNGIITAAAGTIYQKEFCEKEIQDIAKEVAQDLSAEPLLSGLVYAACPGGVLKPLKKGCYFIDEAAAKDAADNSFGNHPYNRLTVLTYEIGKRCGLKAVMLYPMSSDELLPVNRCTSYAGIRKYSRYHAMEHQMGQRYLCDISGKKPEDINCIIAFVDDLVSVGACERGICLDVNDCIGAEGPMGLTSSGDVPVAQIAGYFMEKCSSFAEMEEQLMHHSGLCQYTGITDMEELDRQYADNECVRAACEALAYQTAKWIGSSTLVLKGKVDYILLMGKAMKSKVLQKLLKMRVEKIAQVLFMDESETERYMKEEGKILGTNGCPVYDY